MKTRKANTDQVNQFLKDKNQDPQSTRELSHTPTPWQIVNEMDIATVNDRRWLMSTDNEADAAFIVKAVNMHDDLLASLKRMIEDVKEMSSPFALEEAKRVIAQLEGE